MPALRMTLCLLRWNSLAATQSPPKNSSVTLRMGKPLEALTAPVEGRRDGSGYAPVSPETPLLRLSGVCKPDRAERERSPHIPSGCESGASHSGACVREARRLAADILKV